MDTTEELSGTYFYHGHANVTAQELFLLIYVERLSEHLGLDVTTTAMILGGQPWIPVSGKLSAINNTPGTSVVSKLARALLKEKRIPFGLRLSAPMGKGAKIKLVPTSKMAPFIGRWIPWLGYAQIVIMLEMVGRSTRNKYNLIARPEHRIAWTYF
ncbi:hypothetical protein GW579_02695 [Rahnella sp. Lac-M11]|jgi:hypothetical protein|uniref:Uncharacterized protein n=1 Tax=Rahnella contaminans TaxID=2703882 RepID=A0A6M2AZF2_9GAMM|nr:hypothetical protein [Rahnella contaminans]MDF1893998.1 hypothetical protein [Rahnella contaminans]NGX85992.1 hypothetical protein [Rahnella contaminans]